MKYIKHTTFIEARENAIRIFNLTGLKTRGQTTWTALFITEKSAEIICDEDELIDVIKSILKGGNKITEIRHPTTTDMVLISSFQIKIEKGE